MDVLFFYSFLSCEAFYRRNLVPSPSNPLYPSMVVQKNVSRDKSSSTRSVRMTGGTKILGIDKSTSRSGEFL